VVGVTQLCSNLQAYSADFFGRNWSTGKVSNPKNGDFFGNTETKTTLQKLQ